MSGPLPPHRSRRPGAEAPPRVVVAAYRSGIEAHLARARLASEGLEVALAGEHTAAVLVGVQSVELLVPAEDAERARALLAPLAVERAGGSSDWVTGDLDAPRCRACGSLRVAPERRLLPLPARSPRLRCGTCGARDALGRD